MEQDRTDRFSSDATVEIELPLGKALQCWSDPAKWQELAKFTDGTEAEALAAVSGELPGRIRLAGEIASKLGQVGELERVRRFEQLRDSIVREFDDQRRRKLFVLKGYTSASLVKPLAIPRELPLEYDFENGTAKSGELKFHGLIVATGEGAVVRADATRPKSLPAVAKAELQKFCLEWAKTHPQPPSQDELYRASRTAFSDHKVTRDRVIERHREIWPNAKQGRRGARPKTS